MLTYTPNKYKGGVMLPILKEKNVTENSLAVPYSHSSLSLFERLASQPLLDWCFLSAIL